MKAQQIKILESYFNTQNDHWNTHCFSILCQILQDEQFENPEIPLKIFNMSIDVFTEFHQTPLKAVQLLYDEMNKYRLTERQSLFLIEQVVNFLNMSEFDFKTGQIEKLLIGHKNKLKASIEPKKVDTINIRENLKATIQKELESLPELLKNMEPEKRLNLICKLLPHVLPRFETISSEPKETDKGIFGGFFP